MKCLGAGTGFIGGNRLGPCFVFAGGTLASLVLLGFQVQMPLELTDEVFLAGGAIISGLQDAKAEFVPHVMKIVQLLAGSSAHKCHSTIYLIVKTDGGMHTLLQRLECTWPIVTIAIDDRGSPRLHILGPTAYVAAVQLVNIWHLATQAGQDTIVDPFDLTLGVATGHQFQAIQTLT